MSPKRTRGAQPGNTNAVKHGFYSRNLTPQQAAAYERARTIDPESLDEEIALTRARIDTLIAAAPERFDLFVQGVRALATLIATRHRMQPGDQDELLAAVERIANLGSTLEEQP